MDSRVKFNVWFPAQLDSGQALAGRPKNHVKRQLRELVARQMSCYSNGGEWIDYAADDVEILTFEASKDDSQAAKLDVILLDDFSDRERNMSDRLTAIQKALENLTGLPKECVEVRHMVLVRRRQSLLTAA